MTGTIIRLDQKTKDKGYCFIRGDEDGISRFAHARAFVDPLAFDRAREGQAVRYTPVTDTSSLARSGGARAVEIVLLPAGYAVEKL
jgi:cold shock CspA family protein